MGIINKCKGVLTRLRTVGKNNERGLTLIEMLIAMLIFALATVYIVKAVTGALDNPRESGIRATFSTFDSAAQILLMDTMGNIPGNDMKAFIHEFNRGLHTDNKFDPTDEDSMEDNPYGNPYYIDIKTNKDKKMASIVITTEGKLESDEYVLGVYYYEGEVYSGVEGFGRNSKYLQEWLIEDMTGGSTDISAGIPTD